MALILMTALLATSLFRLLRVDRGFQASRIITATLNLPEKSYSDKQIRTAFFKQAAGRLAQLPGVDSAAAVGILPLTGDSWIDMIRLPGDSRPAMQIPSEHFRWVTPGYFDVIHLPLVAGRFLQPGDEGKNYAVVSELTAHTLWPDRNPIGQQFHRAGMNEKPFTVIGVAANARTVSLSTPDPMMVYMPYWYRCDENAGLLVRTREDSTMIADAIRKTIWSIDPQVPVPLVRSLSGVITDSLANRRFEMDLLLLFAVSALLLAGLGVFGVVSYSVVHRQRELGLRLALGAPRASIYRLVLQDGLLPVLVGGAAGIAVAVGFARVLQSMLFQVSAYNPAILSSSACLLALVGAAACLFPARRAAGTDPMHALRQD